MADIIIETGGQGVPGLSAYQLAVANGFVGTEAQWLVSLSAGAGSFEIDLLSLYNLNK